MQPELNHKKSKRLWIAIFTSLGVLIFIFGVIAFANTELGIISIAFPSAQIVSQKYFEAAIKGDEKAIINLTTEQDLCHDLTLQMAHGHIAKYKAKEIRDLKISTGYWEEAPTDFSPAREQNASITFEFRGAGQTQWQPGEIRLAIWQVGWKRIVCGWPG